MDIRNGVYVQVKMPRALGKVTCFNGSIEE